jgi:hypothetical protein
VTDIVLLSDLKELLGLPEEDHDIDRKLTLILTGTKKRLKFLLGGLDPPDEMDYIILDVSIIRYNKLGSEGLSSHSVEGESLSWSDNDFSGYMDDINAYLDERNKNKRKGGFKFL